MAHHPHNFNDRYMCIVCECVLCVRACVRVYVCVRDTKWTDPLNNDVHFGRSFSSIPFSLPFFPFHPIHIQDANQLKLDVSDKPTSRMKQEAPIFTLFFLYHT